MNMRLMRITNVFLALLIVWVGHLSIPSVHAAGSATRSITWTVNNAIKETAANDGTVNGKYTATLKNDTFIKSVKVGGTLPSKAYSITGVPQGIQVKLVKTASNKVAVLFSGKAKNHTSANNVTAASKKIVLTFKDAAFTGGKAIKVSNYTYAKFAVTFRDPPRQQFEQTKIVDNGDDADKLVIVFLGDGYTKDEQEKFNADADMMVEAFLNEEPFKSLSDRINFYRINVVSKVSGASPDPDHIRDTYFGSAYNSYGIERLLVPTNYEALDTVLAKSNINYDSAVVIVNDEKYGGSGGVYPTTSVHEDAKEIMLHEFGHSYAGLGDEYFAGDYYTDEAPNVTRVSDPKKVKWKDFVGKQGIGVVPMTGTTGWYIPSHECKMEFLGYAFCAVCQDVIRKMILSEALKAAS